MKTLTTLITAIALATFVSAPVQATDFEFGSQATLTDNHDFDVVAAAEFNESADSFEARAGIAYSFATSYGVWEVIPQLVADVDRDAKSSFAGAELQGSFAPTAFGLNDNIRLYTEVEFDSDLNYDNFVGGVAVRF